MRITSPYPALDFGNDYEIFTRWLEALPVHGFKKHVNEWLPAVVAWDSSEMPENPPVGVSS